MVAAPNLFLGLRRQIGYKLQQCTLLQTQRPQKDNYCSYVLVVRRNSFVHVLNNNSGCFITDNQYFRNWLEHQFKKRMQLDINMSEKVFLFVFMCIWWKIYYFFKVIKIPWWSIFILWSIFWVMKKLSMILFNINNQYFIILENKSLDNRVFAKCSPNILNGHHFKFLNIVFRMIKNVICNSCYVNFCSHIVIT